MDSRNPNEIQWTESYIVECLGERNHIRKVKDEELYRKRHLNQLRKASDIVSKDIIIENEQIEPKIVDELPSVPFILENSDFNFQIKNSHSNIQIKLIAA